MNILYSNYLKSKHWFDFKNKKLKACGHKRCAICADTKKVELHHVVYRSNLTDAELADTRWLCRRCHQLTHDLIKAGKIKFTKPKNPSSCFAITKNLVKKELGISGKNMFYPNETTRPPQTGDEAPAGAMPDQLVQVRVGELDGFFTRLDRVKVDSSG